MARLLGRSPSVHGLLRRLVWSDGAVEILGESRNSAAAHQIRWAQALEQGSTLTLFPESPKGQEPENFAEHWKHCRCTYLHWFLDRGVANEVRTILDVGCGGGHTTEHFLRQGFDVTGVTGNPYERIECARRGIKVLEGDFHFLATGEASFDMVFSSHSLEHSISPLFAIAEWKRVVRPGGYVMIVLPMPIEEDLRVAYYDHYDPITDTMDFGATSGEAFSPEGVRPGCYTYGVPSHMFVLSYWQLTWLFRIMGLGLVAAGVEDPVTAEQIGLEHVDGRLPRDPLRALNGLFLLQKP
jgi:SAM-dependent methyltransferase